jgi:hypothetical protein
MKKVFWSIAKQTLGLPLPDSPVIGRQGRRWEGRNSTEIRWENAGCRGDLKLSTGRDVR